MLRIFAASAFSLIASASFAQGPVEASCRLLSTVTEGKQVVNLSRDQWELMRGVFARDPHTPDRMPVGDRAIAFAHFDESGSNDGLQVFFVDGDQACDGVGVPLDHVWILENVASGTILHPDAKSQDHGT